MTRVRVHEGNSVYLVSCEALSPKHFPCGRSAREQGSGLRIRSVLAPPGHVDRGFSSEIFLWSLK